MNKVFDDRTERLRHVNISEEPWSNGRTPTWLVCIADSATVLWSQSCIEIYENVLIHLFLSLYNDA